MQRRGSSGYTAATALAMARGNARRERVLRLMEEGKTKPQIMEELDISRATINLYLRRRVK